MNRACSTTYRKEKKTKFAKACHVTIFTRLCGQNDLISMVSIYKTIESKALSLRSKMCSKHGPEHFK